MLQFLMLALVPAAIALAFAGLYVVIMWCMEQYRLRYPEPTNHVLTNKDIAAINICTYLSAKGKQFDADSNRRCAAGKTLPRSRPLVPQKPHARARSGV